MEAVHDRLLEDPVEIGLVLVVEEQVAHHDRHGPEQHRIRVLQVAELFGEIRGRQRVDDPLLHLFRAAAVRLVVEQDAVPLQRRQVLFERGLVQRDQKVALLVDHRGTDRIPAQHDRAVRGSAAHLRAVARQPRDVEVPQLAHRGEHVTETQHPLSARAAELDPPLGLEDARRVAERFADSVRHPDRIQQLAHRRRLVDALRPRDRVAAFGGVLVDAERKIAAHLVVEEFVHLPRAHFQVDRAAGEQLDQREPLPLDAVGQRLADREPRLADLLHRRQRAAFDVNRRVERRDRFGDLQRIPLACDAAPQRTGLGLLARQRGRRHLPAGHAVDRVVHEEHRHVFAAVRGLQDVVETDRGKVAVPLVRDHEVVGIRPREPGSDRRGASVRRRDAEAVEIVVAEHGAADRRDDDRLVLDSEILDRLGDELVQDAVAAAGAVVHIRLDRPRTAFEAREKAVGTAVKYFFAHDAHASFAPMAAMVRATISSMVAMLPPMRLIR